MCRQALPASKPPGECRVPPGAKRLNKTPRGQYRLAGRPSSLGAHVAVPFVGQRSPSRNFLLPGASSGDFFL